jgi:Spy/CpxP family protein refolding chaperone
MRAVHAFSLVLGSLLLIAGAHAAEQPDKDEWLRGRLFGPEVILKNQSKLKLTDKQLAQIGVELKRVQAEAAESDWQIMTEGTKVQQLIDAYPVDDKAVLSGVDKVFEAENRKKRLYVQMLVTIKNLLTEEQVAYLKSVSQ